MNTSRQTLFFDTQLNLIENKWLLVFNTLEVNHSSFLTRKRTDSVSLFTDGYWTDFVTMKKKLVRT